MSNATDAGPEAISPAGPSQPQPNAPQLQTFSHVVNEVPQMPHIERIALQEMLGLVGAPNGPHAPSIPSLPNLPSGISDNSSLQPGIAPITLPQILAQRDQARAAAGLDGLGTEGTPTVPTPSFGGPFPPGNVTTAVLSGSSQTVQETHGPNGELWRITVTGPTHHYQGQLNQAGGNPNTMSNSHHHHPRYQNQSINSTPRPLTPQATDSTGTPEATPRPRQNLGSAQLNRDSHPLLVFEEYVSAMEADIAGGEAPGENIFGAARTVLQRVSEQGASALTINRLRNHLDHLSIQADHIRARSFMRVAVDVPGAPRARPPGSFSPIYLLSSPNGPHALLVSPYGMYATPWPLPIQTGNALAPRPREHLHSSPAANPPNAPNVQQAPGNVPQVLQAPQQRQQEQPNQARDLIRVLLPLGGHLWLLVRLFGFVYFFTAGGGYRRALLLGFCAFIVFIVQTGIFRPLIQQAWEPLRRHIESLLPLANNNDHRPVPQAAPHLRNNNNNNNPHNHQDLATNMMLTPQQAAERMLQERQNRAEGLTRQYIRRAERAIALFIASLVPGVGERHIAAREAAEAARLEEERARERAEEERLKKEREEQEGHSETSGSNDREREAKKEIA